ncbi:hypothetical protein Kpol_312p7 [Vanderwaltozyma polyspora DSM 70294]|uniref:phosphoinositide 5-phosphatase n=1 Tax=Vanderwaltozyma polyspora (strain ATCC 22028 / DSM 70294 / BCRC 21397 / CBS 2163 / NBRC 10782 / NRRL Y-8283 / UCD 57-17) TaxID=436907 RepID=A7TSJ0_VANPO|nr:uncharacterized protein Kpol_312p7 [Vanderwaltozyma polyspora DSM 70294]EDO14768.1 hypothetical protein Kpol_312p7 [Vanderwaltozyma polyspora DSM 70294]
MKLYVGREPREIVVSSNGYNICFQRFQKAFSAASQQTSQTPIITIKQISDKDLIPEKYTEVKSRIFNGLLGLLSVDGEIYIGVISGIQKVGFPRWKYENNRIIPMESIFKVLDVDFYSLDTAAYDHLIYEVSEQNTEKLIHEHPCGSIKKLFSDGTFYYSRDYDISNEVKNHSLFHNLDYIIENQDLNFIWNKTLVSEIVTWRSRIPIEQKQIFDGSEFLTFLIRGFCKTTMVEDSDFYSSITVISRISTENKQDTFEIEGIKEDGKVSNFVETEVIVTTDSYIYSYTQISANVPLFWEVIDSQILYGKKMRLTKEIENMQVAFDRHFDNLASKYGVVSIVNLVKPRSESQEIISNAYKHCADIKGIKITNVQLSSDNLANSPHKFLYLLEQDIYEFGAFIYDRTRGIYIGKQTGALRISSFDSVKRTTLVEKLVSKEVLELATKEVPEFRLVNTFIDTHDKLWTENYYWLDRMYTKNTKNLGKFRKVYYKLFSSRVKLYDPLNSYISRYLRQMKGTFSCEKEITIFSGTFNTSGKISSDGIDSWIFPKNSGINGTADIYIIGLEEVVELTPGHMLSTDPYVKQYWEKKVLHLINSKSKEKKYVCVWSSQLGGVLLLLFISESEYMKVKHIEGDVKKTGFGGMASNKGAASVSFKYSETRFCVIVSHLAAGLDNVEQRHSDYKTIVENIRFSKGLRIKDHDAIIWMGDFNYRILMSNEEVRKLITAKEFAKLFERDQLNQQMIAGASFPYYHEMEIKFPPTYKFNPGTKVYDTSEKMRIPAWTDRILSRGEVLNQLSYGCAEDIIYSDHRPVYATFNAKVTVVDEQKKSIISKEVYDTITKKLVSLNEEEKLTLLSEGSLVLDDIDSQLLQPKHTVTSNSLLDAKRGMKLPPPSSDLKKWWIGNGKQAKVILDVDANTVILNPNRSSNPFVKDDSNSLFIPR